MDSTATDTEEAARLRNAMVDAWAGWRTFPERVEQAMRTVPRHLFLPGRPLADAYEDSIVFTHRDVDGTVLSCTTLPRGVAEMLEQLDVQPGHRVLEIGAGTGLNAALLACLAGPDGHVTTIDILPEAAQEARQGLAAAGYLDVTVICGDGALGHPAGSPYDRIVVTAGSWDVPPAWREQAAADAVMVVPLRVAGFTHVVAFERDQRSGGQVWRSRDSRPFGFIKMRGEGQHAEHDLPIVAGGQSELRLEGDLYADQAALVHATSQPALQRWTSVATSDLRLTDLELWLAQLGGVCRLINRRPGHGLAPAVGEGGSLAVLASTGDTFAYFTFGPADGDGQREIGISAYGLCAAGLADRVAGRVRAWAADRPRLTAWIELYPIGVPVPSLEDVLLDVPKVHVRIIVRTAPCPGLAGG